MSHVLFKRILKVQNFFREKLDSSPGSFNPIPIRAEAHNKFSWSKGIFDTTYPQAWHYGTQEEVKRFKQFNTQDSPRLPQSSSFLCVPSMPVSGNEKEDNSITARQTKRIRTEHSNTKRTNSRNWEEEEEEEIINHHVDENTPPMKERYLPQRQESRTFIDCSRIEKSPSFKEGVFEESDARPRLPLQPIPLNNNVSPSNLQVDYFPSTPPLRLCLLTNYNPLRSASNDSSLPALSCFGSFSDYVSSYHGMIFLPPPEGRKRGREGLL
jgi:hypothetical protein